MRRLRQGLGILGGPSSIGDLFPSRTGAQDDFDANMAAIVDYFNSTEAKTIQAAQIKDEWAKWNNGLTFLDTHWNTGVTYNTARNYRDSFEKANATTDAEKQAVAMVQKTGITTEQTWGDPAVALTSSGQRAIPPDKPWPSWLKWTVGGAIGVGMLYALGKVTTLAEIFVGKRGSAPPESAHIPNRTRRRRRARR